MRPHQQGHLVDAAMAAFASNAAVDMDRVIEENIIGQLRHPVPDQRLAAGEALPHLRQHRRAGPYLGVAGHADMRGRKARMGTPLHCRMAEAAIDPKAVDMMFMAERDRLGNRPSNLRSEEHTSELQTLM